MPKYSFQNKENDDVIELTLSLAEREEFLETYPHFKQIITHAPALGDSVRLGIRHADRGFNDVLQKIKSHHRGSNIDTR
jgi:hypothetical protein